MPRSAETEASTNRHTGEFGTAHLAWRRHVARSPVRGHVELRHERGASRGSAPFARERVPRGSVGQHLLHESFYPPQGLSHA